MEENRRLDDELADLTDAIIENREMKTSQDIADLAEIARGLRDLIEPNAPPSAAFEARMKTRLDMEWEQRQRRATRMRVNPAVRLIALAAAVVVVMVVIIFLTNNPGNDPQVVGTVLESPETLIAAVAVAAVVGAAILVWRNRR
jgi:ABC-type Fe3+-siderophore transport system permease subunit